jgi:precorrin-4/cobalt-precorrin-4 C11-methyltransferase
VKVIHKIWFVGAGPGDPELITLKGRRLLDEAEVIIYAGSLVNPALLNGLKAEIHDSSGMTLEEIVAFMRQAYEAGRRVVRLHTGDTAFYSAISEQIERLRQLNIPYEVVPGVSSAMAGAALLGQELTIPEISQTVIFTRIEGRTPVPEREKLSKLAEHGASMVIFLSVSMIGKVVEELRAGYSDDTPVVVIERVTWPEERVVSGTLADIADRVKSAGIKKTALIYVGDALKASAENTGRESRLYNRTFSHGYREGDKS